MSVFGDIGVKTPTVPPVRQVDHPVVSQVWLLYLNYSVVGAFNDADIALATAEGVMAIHGGQWERVIGPLQQWFNRGVGNYVEIVEQDVRGKA